MKVVFATGIFPPDIGGPAMSVSMLAEAWSAQGHHVEVVTYADAPDSNESRPYSVRRILRGQPAWKRSWAFLAALWKASAAPGVIFAQDGMTSGLPALIVARLRKRRLVLRIAGDYAWERAQVRHGYADTLETFQRDPRISPVLMILRALQRFVYRHADQVIAPSNYLSNLVQAWGVSKARIRLIYNGVQTPQVAPPAQMYPHRIVYAGRLVPWKRVDVLIKAMSKILRRIPEAELLIIGEGPERMRLEDLASWSHLASHVRFIGRVSPEQVCRELAASGAHALVSSYEGFSHQLVTGFLCGAPTVASRAGGNTELIEDGRNGLFVEPGDIEGTATALIKMLEDRAFAAKCAAEARKDCARFNVETQILQTSEAVLGDGKFRVVLISRDGTAADLESRTAARMRLYGESVDFLQIICLAKRDAVSVELSPSVRVDVIDVRGVPRPWKLVRRVYEAIQARSAALVVAQDPFEAGLIGSLAARWARVPCIVEEHGGVFLSDHWKGEVLKNQFLFPLGLQVLKRAAGIRAVSVKIENDLRARFPSKPIARVPVSTEPRHCRSSGAPHVFGYVGRFVPQKNLFGLLEAFAQVVKAVPEARLLMVGAGPLENGLKARAFVLGLTNVVEWIAHAEQIDAAYERIGTLVLPSWYEGWGRVVPEAMSCGIPVIMTDVGCANELPRNGIEGYIVPVGDDAIFAQAMIEIAQQARHALMVAAAKRRAEMVSKPAALAGELIEFWKKISGA